MKNKKNISEVGQIEQVLETLFRDYEKEKQCKNEAYYFIISNNLIDKFRLFLETHKQKISHKDIINHLYNTTQKTPTIF